MYVMSLKGQVTLQSESVSQGVVKTQRLFIAGQGKPKVTAQKTQQVGEEVLKGCAKFNESNKKKNSTLTTTALI